MKQKTIVMIDPSQLFQLKTAKHKDMKDLIIAINKLTETVNKLNEAFENFDTSELEAELHAESSDVE